MLKFVVDEPALVIDRTLVIADLHLGLEYELLQSGFNVPDQVEKMLERIQKIHRENRCKDIIIVGDLKHRIVKVSWPEQEEVSDFMAELEKLGKVTVVKGNHDSNIENYVKNVVPSSGFDYKGYWILHGHTNPPKEALKKTMIMGHVHPRIEFKDALGGKVSERVWVKSDRVIIMPAFNYLLGSTSIMDGELLGPIKKYIDPKKAELYLLDGLHLGTMHEIRKRFEHAKAGHRRH